MATAAQIKSAIRSQSTGQRKMMSSLADVGSSLMSAKESSMMFDLKQQEKKTMYDTLYSGLELGETILGSIEQKREIAKGVERFKEALSPDLRKDFRMEKTSLSDVLKGKKGSLTSYLTGKQEYFIGDKSIGSQYDVSARGDEIFSKRLAKNLLEMTEGESLMDKPTPTLQPMESIKFDMSKIGGMKLPTIQVKEDVSKDIDYDLFGGETKTKDDPYGIYNIDIPQSILDKYS
tara:strand:- start:648 stop:1346 length:699 start_codon:yes stop_codon:yes gene_type:complete